MVARDKEDLSGQQIGNYEIESHIAARPASDLFLARDVKLERLVFLEVLRVTEEEDQNLVERFRRRMETVSQLKDPHVAVVSDFDVTDDGFPYAVIDYFPGETLAEKLADLRHDGQTLPVIEALELTKQIAQGLGVAHTAGLTHHDLRPENVMLSQDGAPILIDFGVPVVPHAQPPGVNGAEGELLDYTAPEVAEGKPLTRRSNIYSLGVILYELLAGHQPKLPNLPYDIFPQANMPKEEPLEEARPGLAGETYRLVRNCLWRQEWSRFETTDELITAIETAIFAEQELPKATTAWTPQRGRSMAFVIPIALVLVGILAFFLLRGIMGNRNAQADEPTAEGTPAGTFVAGADTAEPSPTESPTAELPTEAAQDFSINVVFPAPNREFTLQDTISFEWYWPTLPEPGMHFAVYLIDGEQEHLLGALDEPNNGGNYLLAVPGADIPATGEELGWQIRLESVAGGDVFVASDVIPIIIRDALPTPTAATTDTVAPTAGTPTVGASPTVCAVDPPPGWIYYTVRAGDSLSDLAENANILVETLLQVNCLPNVLLSVGQQIWVPPGSVPRTPTPPSLATPTNPPRPTSPPSATDRPTTIAPTTAPTDPPTTAPTDQPTEPPATDAPTNTPPSPVTEVPP
ncbi:putative Calcium/calmodulin-dependent protein kinase [Candidatus Promineifilum breve]|uniref:non-specific serine/threonine protein kinase n=1 Tax=Candidatus Promineifilum breve TaxID=1806508 RepID=A0A160T7L6_9CHLR|nr:protein kinase [Candidatus Promineifilum breve]CUS05095.2 putative Calcium/calmodulin-dependent protein kinase [Candidatus Promineifilum breve]